MAGDFDRVSGGRGPEETGASPEGAGRDPEGASAARSPHGKGSLWGP